MIAWLDQYIEQWNDKGILHRMINPTCSWQSYEGLQVTVHSFKEVSEFLFEQGISYILSERFCQDDLENYFGRQRAIGHRRDNPTV